MDKVTITLSAQAYNWIVKAVQELPWRLAQPIFNEVDPQVQEALRKEAAAIKPSAADAAAPKDG